MKVNKKLLPIKAHYFCFLGCVSPILPFLVVLGQQLGIPVSIMGTTGAVSLLLVVLMKPILAALADTYPSYRRCIFIMTLIVMVTSYSSLSFVSPMQGLPRVEGQLEQVQSAVGGAAAATTTLVSVAEEGHRDGDGDGDGVGSGGSSLLLAAREDGGECYVAVAWDCVARCGEPWNCFNATTTTTTTTTPSVMATLVSHHHHHNLQLIMEGEGAPPFPSILEQDQEEKQPRRVYRLEGTGVSKDLFPGNLSLECGSGRWEGPGCLGVWNYWQFWIFVMLLFLGQVAFNTAISVTDAIIVDTIGENGDYGIQRAWGTVGWGLMGPMSGLLVDWQSGTSITKDYMPAFLLCLTLGSADVLISASSIKVPRITTEHSVFKKVWPIIRQPRFFVFCIFVIFNGMFDGVVASYIFIMQEEMAKGTSAMNYMKFLQGMTLFVQCGLEAPFMFINNWFLRTMGAQYVISLVFFLYMFRLLGLAVVGAYGPVWATLVVELLNGPCYGLGYIAIVTYSYKLSPPGASTTVQSVVNICYESLGYAAAAFFGGLLFTSLGGPGLYLVVGIISVIIFILHLLSLKLLPPPDEHCEENNSLEKKQVGEEEKLSPNSVAEEADEGSALALRVDGEQEALEMA